jgi:phosphate-selective porin OprO/OprP
LELALRYDQSNVADTPLSARRGNKAHSLTAGLNWYWNPFVKLQFNYIRFAGTNTPLDPIGDKTKGQAIATRLHIDW